MENFYSITEQRHEEVEELGTLKLSFDLLKGRGDIVSKRLGGGSTAYDCCCKVTGTVSEQFFHVLHFKAYWAPYMHKDDQALPNSEDRMEVDEGTLVDIGAAFQLSTV
jgi:hypothetical protein